NITKEYRKAGTDRRGGADRRQSSLSRYHDTERRTGNERRIFEDRRLRVLLTKKQSNPNSGLIGFLLKTSWKRGPKQGKKRKSHSVPKNTVFLDEPKKRLHERLACETSVQIHDKDTSGVFPGTARNYSVAGMYLESDYAPRVGAGLVLRMVNHKIGSPAPEDITKYHSRVVWREKLSGNVVFMRYGIGVKHCQDLEEFLRLFGY
ncbi:MAG: hypothetical protein ABF291_16090, partial [Desulfobacterales bacterium]